MTRDTETGPGESLRTVLMTIGVVLIGGGAVLLIMMAMLVYQVLTAPQDVMLVQYVLDHVRAGDRGLYGHMTDAATGRQMDFELNWSDSVRTISFLFLGVAIMGILAAIAKTLVNGGIGLVRLAAPAQRQAKGDKDSL